MESASQRSFPRVPSPEPVVVEERPPITPPLRIAFTTARGPEVARFAALAADADADVLLARSPVDVDVDAATLGVIDVAAVPATVRGARGVTIATIAAEAFRSPRALIADRLRGCDLFVWHASGDTEWNVPFARTRAAELRAYVVVYDGDDRSFAVDPDGAIVAGTFDGFRMATFVYDRARAASTMVAPTTDVHAGLREVERIRATY
ncbi:MAG: hypothetical protein IAI50_13680 [Candidatus Eremiobacteraeota bacterium]|nr:hypothetical protein [Candidatus Eremiobacteraeota bacterium]